MVKINSILFTILLVYATIFEVFNDKGRNMLVIFIVPVLLITIVVAKRTIIKQLFNREYLPLLYFICFYIISTLINFHVFKLSSLVYTLNFTLTFFILSYLLKVNVDIKTFKRWLIIVISIFFYALILQQLGVLFNIDNFFNKSEDITYNIQENFLYRLNSIATEPSYAATIISICLFSYLKLYRFENNNVYSFNSFIKDGFIWFIYLYQIFFYSSVFGILFFMLILFYLVNLKSLKNWIYLFFILIIFLSIKVDFVAFNRLTNIFENMDFTNIEGFSQIDHSGSIRILPTYFYITNFDFFNYQYYLGFGLDYSQNFIRTLIPGIEEETPFGGLLPTLIFDFGLISFLFLARFIFKFTLTRLISFETAFILLVMVNATLNTQLFWFVLIVLTVNMYLTSTSISNDSNQIQ